MNAARTFDNKKLRPYVEATVTVFLNEIKSHCKESINHWLEDLTIDFNRLEQDKVINMFEANFNLKYLILSTEEILIIIKKLIILIIRIIYAI